MADPLPPLCARGPKPASARPGCGRIGAVTSELLPGENLIVKANPHWIVIVKYLLPPAVLLVLVAIADLTFLQPINQPTFLLQVQHLRIYLALAAIAIAGIWLIVVYIRWQSTTYTLTDQRIKIETGVFGRQSKMIPIDRIQDCTSQNAFRDQVFIQSEKRRGGAPAAPASPSGV